MKKNKFRNGGYNNQGYSLNFKFDSVSPAGKCSGTALDLIKRYNDLAKEAHGNGDYIEAEVFRQYAEHYRKIVTEINERKQRFEPKDSSSVVEASTTISGKEDQAANTDAGDISESSPTDNTLIETKPKKAFTVIEITDDSSEVSKPKRTYKPRQKKTSDENAVNA